MSTKREDDRCACFYSYIPPNSEKTLRGPLCMNCMNICYQDDPTQFHSQEEQDSNVSIYLHTEEGGKPFSMNELIYLNGSSTPFTFRKLAKDEKLRSFNCVTPKCDLTFKSTNGLFNSDSGTTSDFQKVAPGSESSSIGVDLRQFAALGCIEGVAGGMEAEHVKKSLIKFHIITAKIDLEVLSEYYVGYFNEVDSCPLCDVAISAGPAIVHVLSQKHQEQIVSSGKLISLYEMCIMSGFFKQLIRKHVESQKSKQRIRTQKVEEEGARFEREEIC